jgi:hypothetical protein
MSLIEKDLQLWLNALPPVRRLRRSIRAGLVQLYRWMRVALVQLQ